MPEDTLIDVFLSTIFCDFFSLMLIKSTIKLEGSVMSIAAVILRIQYVFREQIHLKFIFGGRNRQRAWY